MPRSFIQTVDAFAAESGIAFEIDARLADVEAGPARVVFVGRGTSMQASMLHDVEVTVRDAGDAEVYGFEPGRASLKLNMSCLPEPITVCVRKTTGSVEKTILVAGGEHARAAQDDLASSVLSVKRDKGGVHLFEMLTASVTATLYAMMHHRSEHGCGSDRWVEADCGMGYPGMGRMPPF